jgi:hypothetical protein
VITVEASQIKIAPKQVRGRVQLRLPIPDDLHPVVAGEKLTLYLLNLAHPEGGPKAKFLTGCGFVGSNPSALRDAIAGSMAASLVTAASLPPPMKGVFGKRICPGYAPDGDTLVTRETIDGIAWPDQQKVLRVGLSDGFEVRP